MQNFKLLFLLVFLVPAGAQAMQQQSLVSFEALEKAPGDLKTRMAQYLNTDLTLGTIDRTRVALARAIKAGDEEAVAFILNTLRSTAIRDLVLWFPAPGLGLVLPLAAQEGHRRIVKLLIDAGASKGEADDPSWSLKDSILIGNAQAALIGLEHGKFSQKQIDDMMTIAQTTKGVEQERAKTEEEMDRSRDLVMRIDAIIQALKKYEVMKKL